MQELKKAYAKWRKILIRTNICIVIFAFSVELLMFFLLKESGLIFQPIPKYLMLFLLIPTIINVGIIISGKILNKYIPQDSKYINYIPIAQLAIICAVYACIHNLFSITLCFFCFPLFISFIFGDKKMMRKIAFLCVVLLTFVLLCRKYGFYSPGNDIYIYAEAVVAYMIFVATYAISNVLFKFQEEKSDIIFQSYQCQLEMQDQLNKDQKTGLYGQTIFTNMLNQLVERSGTVYKSILLAIIDIDDFKNINDTYGHLKGDQIILTLAETMKTVFHQNQFISRFGGEEFAIIFPEGETDSAVASLEELRTSFEKMKYDWMDENVTISIGIAKEQMNWTSEQLFEAADFAMYSAKKSGKNKTMVYNKE